MTASSSSNPPTPEGRRGQPTIITTSFIREQIDMGLNDIMLELSKQLANIVKPMFITRLAMKDNSTLATPWENIASGNALAS